MNPTPDAISPTSTRHPGRHEWFAVTASGARRRGSFAAQRVRLAAFNGAFDFFFVSGFLFLVFSSLTRVIQHKALRVRPTFSFSADFDKRRVKRTEIGCVDEVFFQLCLGCDGRPRFDLAPRLPVSRLWVPFDLIVAVPVAMRGIRNDFVVGRYFTTMLTRREAVTGSRR